MPFVILASRTIEDGMWKKHESTFGFLAVDKLALLQPTLDLLHIFCDSFHYSKINNFGTFIVVFVCIYFVNQKTNSRCSFLFKRVDAAKQVIQLRCLVASITQSLL